MQSWLLNCAVSCPAALYTGPLRRASLAHPHSRLREVGPYGDLLPHTHVWVAVPLERGLQLLQLLACEVRALPPLFFLFGWVLSAAATRAARATVFWPLGFPAALLLCSRQERARVTSGLCPVAPGPGSTEAGSAGGLCWLPSLPPGVLGEVPISKSCLGAGGW